MSPIKKTSKVDIIKAAFEILQEKGIEKVSARDIAKKLSISVQPIFYQFNSMDDLKRELLQYALNYYQKFLFEPREDMPKYKAIGINYIRFAKENPNIFKFIFMGEYHIKIDNFAYFDKSYEDAEIILKDQKNISEDQVKNFHLKMWIFTHGIACLVANNTCEFNEEQIKELLTDEFQTLVEVMSKN